MKIEEAVILFDLSIKLQPIIEKYNVTSKFTWNTHTEIEIKASFNTTFIKINNSHIEITCTDPSIKNTYFELATFNDDDFCEYVDNYIKQDLTKVGLWYERRGTDE